MPRTIMLSQINREALYRIVSFVVKQTKIRTGKGLFRYTVEDIRRALTFGGDFVYGFGDFYKLVFVRVGTSRNKEDPSKYDTLLYLTIELDNTNGLKKSDKIYVLRRKIADEAQEALEGYLSESGIIRAEDQCETTDFGAA